MSLGLQQDPGPELEHTSSGTKIFTDTHGRLWGAISIGKSQAKATYSDVKVLGSAYLVAVGQPDGQLGDLEMMVRKSYLKPFEDLIRARLGASPLARLELAGFKMQFSVVSAAFDEENRAPLPTVVRTFAALYAGHDGDSDRKNADPMTCTIFLKQVTPATET